MNSRTTKDIPCFSSYLPDALHYDLKINRPSGASLSAFVSVIPQYIRLFSDLLHPVSHAHCLTQSHSLNLTPSFMPKEKMNTLAQKSARKNGEKNGEPATAVNLRSVWLSRHYKPGAVVARIDREHDINHNKASTRTAY